MFLIFFIVILAVMMIPNFLLVKKQKEQQNQMQSMQRSIATGDKVVTGAGMHGTVVSAADDTLGIEVAPNVVISFDRSAISRVEQPAVQTAPESGTEPEQVEHAETDSEE